MRKNILFLMVFILLLSGCAVSEKEIAKEKESPVEDSEIHHTAALRCEWPEYDASASGVNVIFTNPLNENFSTGEYYELQVKNQSGRWETVPVIENGGFPAIEYILPPGESRAFFLSFDFHDYDFPSGTYRILKDGYAAEFLLVANGTVSSEQPYGVPALEN